MKNPKKSSFKKRNDIKKMLTSYFYIIRNIGFDQSSLVQPISEFRGGSTSVTDKGEVRTDINPCV